MRKPTITWLQLLDIQVRAQQGHVCPDDVLNLVAEIHRYADIVDRRAERRDRPAPWTVPVRGAAARGVWQTVLKRTAQVTTEVTTTLRRLRVGA